MLDTSPPAEPCLIRRIESVMRAVSVVLTCSLTSLACKDPAPVTHRPPPVRGIGPATPLDQKPNAQITSPRPATAQLSTASLGAVLDRSGAGPRGSGAALEESADDEPRDFARELRSLLPSPASCLGPRPYDSALKPITIQVAAKVMPSGGLGRVEIHSAGLTAAELQCVQRLVSPLRLRGPIDGAPLGVSTQLTLQPLAARPGTPRAAPPGSQPEDDEHPGESAANSGASDGHEPAPPNEPAQDTLDRSGLQGPDERPDDTGAVEQP